MEKKEQGTKPLLTIHLFVNLRYQLTFDKSIKKKNLTLTFTSIFNAVNLTCYRI